MFVLNKLSESESESSSVIYRIVLLADEFSRARK